MPASIEWNWPIDAGDHIHPVFLREAMAAAAAQPELNAIMPQLCVEETGMSWDPVPFQDGNILDKDLLHACVLQRRVLRDLGVVYDPSMRWGWEDWDYWVRVNLWQPVISHTTPTKCSYLYHPNSVGEGHAPCAYHYHQQCQAAFAVATGGAQPVAKVLAAHAMLLSEEGRQFQRWAVAGVPPATSFEHPVRHTMAGILAEAEGDDDLALWWYETAWKVSLGSPRMRKAFAARGSVWQLATRIRAVHLRRQHLHRIGPMCRRAAVDMFGDDAMAATPPAVLALLQEQWNATGCNTQAFMPPRLRYRDVRCSAKGGEVAPGGYCQCFVGFRGEACEEAVPESLSLRVSHEAAADVSVLLVTNELEGVAGGGIGTAMAHLARLLTNVGFQVTVLVVQWLEGQAATDAVESYKVFGVTVEFPEPLRAETSGAPHTVRQADAVLQYAMSRADAFDVIHYSEFGGLGYFLGKAKRLGLLPKPTLVAHLHGMWLWARKHNKQFLSMDGVLVTHMEEASMLDADLIVTESDLIVRYLKDERRLDLPRHKVYDLPTVGLSRGGGGADTTVSKAEVLAPLAAWEIVFWGKSLLVEEGLALFCDAIDALRSIAGNPFAVTFLLDVVPVVEGGEMGDKYVQGRSQPWRDAGIKVNVYTAKTREKEVEYLQQGGRVAALPAKLETSPYVVLDAMHNRIPFVTSGGGDTVALIHEEDRAHAVVAFDAVAMAERLADIVQHGAHLSRPAIGGAINDAKDTDLHIRRPPSAPLVPMSRCFDTVAGAAGNAQRRLRRSSAVLVSVVIANPSGHATLHAEVKAAWEQSHANIEVVVVVAAAAAADAQSDMARAAAALEAAPEFAAEASATRRRSLVVVRRANQVSVGAARNAGAQVAQGEVVLFLEDGAELLPTAVHEAVLAMCQSGADIVGMRPLGYTDPQRRDTEARDFMFMGSLYEKVVRNVASGPVMLVRAATLTAMGGFTSQVDGCVAQELYVRAGLMGLRAQQAVRPLYWRRVNDEGIAAASSSSFECSQSLLHWLRGAVAPSMLDTPELLRSLVGSTNGNSS